MFNWKNCQQLFQSTKISQQHPLTSCIFAHLAKEFTIFRLHDGINLGSWSESGQTPQHLPRIYLFLMYHPGVQYSNTCHHMFGAVFFSTKLSDQQIMMMHFQIDPPLKLSQHNLADSLFFNPYIHIYIYHIINKYIYILIKHIYIYYMIYMYIHHHASLSADSLEPSLKAKRPKTLTLYFSKSPAWYIFTAQFNAVCPPQAAKMPSGFSRSITFSTNSGVTGRK